MIPRSKMEDVLRRLNDMQHNVNQLEKLAKALSDSIHSGIPVLGGRDVHIDDATFWADVASLIDKHQARLRKEQEEVLAQAARRIVSESASC